MSPAELQRVLDQLLTALRKVGFVKSQRGPHGGYVLAKEPMDLNLGMIMNALEGPMVPIDCLDGSLECNLAGHCAQQDIWRKVEGLTQALLYSTKLADLVSSLTVVGINRGTVPEALIEDTQAKRTHFVKVGDQVNGVTISSISSEGVKVTYEGEEAILQ